MAAVTPHVDGAPVPVYSKSIQGLSITSPTLMSDGDTLTFPAFTTLIQAECWFKRIDDGSDVVFTTGTNVVTIGINIPIMHFVPVKGQVVGV